MTTKTSTQRYIHKCIYYMDYPVSLSDYLVFWCFQCFGEFTKFLFENYSPGQLSIYCLEFTKHIFFCLLVDHGSAFFYLFTKNPICHKSLLMLRILLCCICMLNIIDKSSEFENTNVRDFDAQATSWNL